MGAQLEAIFGRRGKEEKGSEALPLPNAPATSPSASSPSSFGR